jgi:YVTN family beta-propeller protein
VKTDRTDPRRATLRSWPGDDPYQLAFLPPPAEPPGVWAIYRPLIVACFGLIAVALVMVFAATRAASRKERADRTPATSGRESTSPVRPAINAFPAGIRHKTVAASATAARGPRLVYVPESMTETVAVIDARTYRIVRRLEVGREPEHVATSGNWLLAGSAVDDSLTLIDARSGRLQRRLRAIDPYNLYSSPDGKTVIVVAEPKGELRLLHPRRLTLMGVVRLPGQGASHLAFTKDGRTLAVAAVDSGDLIKVNVRRRKAEEVTHLGGMPVDIKLSPDGRSFLVANQELGGVSIVDAGSFRATDFIRTGAGAHGLVLSRDGRKLYVANRAAGTISVIDPARRRLVATWAVGGSPDGLQLSTDERELWTSNRFHSSVSVVDTQSGKVRHTIRVNGGPHGLVYFPPANLSSSLSDQTMAESPAASSPYTRRGGR